MVANLHRAVKLPTTSEDGAHKLQHVMKALQANSYSKQTIDIRVNKERHLTPSSEEHVKEFFDMIEENNKSNEFVVLPY